jgi:radical SAM family uncharacterized protein/radical SAM-linked protein
MYEDFLPLVTKPARYINNEINAVRKDLAAVKTTVCLFFPDTYEIGMSHLGLRILYHILNSREDTACERVFSPWTDYEERLRAAGRPLTSLESNKPLASFDLIGITLQYELSYSNILAGLDLARIPLRSADRTDEHPVIIAGGPCAVNPEPLSDFIDVFFIGEAEEALHEIVDLKQAHPDRRGYLKALSSREGFFVPALGQTPVRRRYLKDLDAAPYPDRPLLPLLKPVHDRVAVEVARGCIRGCRFCQAGVIYRPFRERSPGRVKDLLAESLACTGYEELSLASLSSGDYSSIGPLIVDLMRTYHDSRISVSLPSLRVGTLTPEMIEAIAGTRKTGFTFAPEAGTERLRRVINKPVSDLDLLDAAETVFAKGWSVLKLYFMIGLPTETDEDLDGIVRLCNDLLARGKRATKRHVQINVSVSTFVSKPHTPFQWLGQPPMEELRRRQAYLSRGLRKRGINLKLHDPETSVLEASFARGDRALGRVILEAVALGCRFDGWTETFDFKKWREAFARCGLDPAEYACRTLGLDDALPWDHVRSGITKEFLKREYERAQQAEISANCRVECERCGLGCPDGGTKDLGKPSANPEAEQAGVQPAIPKNPSGAQEITARIRMRYTKTGRVRFLSHLDLITLFQRALSRARVPIAFSKGFNPHPKLAFGPALPVGMESLTEYLDLDTDPFIDLPRITTDLNKTLPPGIEILDARAVPRQAPSLSGSISRYVYAVEVPVDAAATIEERVNRFLGLPSLLVSKEGRQKDIRPCIEAIDVTRTKGAAGLLLTLQDRGEIRPRVQDVLLQLFELGPERTALIGIRRVKMYWKNKDQWSDPMET